MLKNIMFLVTIQFILFCCLVTKAFSEEQCVARYDVENNMVYIPCITLGEEKIWANLKLTTPETLSFKVDSFGVDFLPLWLTQMINEFENAPVTNPPRRIVQYQYNEAVVYYITSPCCDQFNYLYDTTGTAICAPDGGLTGRGDGRCTDFGDSDRKGVVVWEEQRKLE